VVLRLAGINSWEQLKLMPLRMLDKNQTILELREQGDYVVCDGQKQFFRIVKLGKIVNRWSSTDFGSFQ